MQNKPKIIRDNSVNISNEIKKLVINIESIPKMLIDKNILYAPDFLINAGGLINVYSELKGFGTDKVMDKTGNIYDTTISILEKSKSENISSQQAALKIAKEKVYLKSIL